MRNSRKSIVHRKSTDIRTPSGRKKSFRKELSYSYSTLNTRAQYYSILEDISATDVLIGSLLSFRSSSIAKKNAFARAKKRYDLNKAVELLEAGGLARRTRTDDDYALSITDKGRRSLAWARIKNLKISRNAHTVWDKKWRMVIFDFPETLRSVRNGLRYVLEKNDWIQIQKSVWAYPYSYDSLRTILLQDERIQENVQFIICDHVDRDEKMRQHFKLK
jgi:hypothetical protein